MTTRLALVRTLHPLTDEEVCATVAHAKAATNRAEQMVKNHFFAPLQAAIRRGDRKTAMTLFLAMPDCVTQIFAVDALQQAGWLKDES